MKKLDFLINVPHKNYQPDPDLARKTADYLLSDETFNQIMIELSDK